MYWIMEALYICLCLCICLFVNLRLGHCHYQMISFQKIYGFCGLKHHMIEINGDVTMETNKQPTGSENRASQQIDQGLLIFIHFRRPATSRFGMKRV